MHAGRQVALDTGCQGRGKVWRGHTSHCRRLPEAGHRQLVVMARGVLKQPCRCGLAPEAGGQQQGWQLAASSTSGWCGQQLALHSKAGLPRKAVGILPEVPAVALVFAAGHSEHLKWHAAAASSSSSWWWKAEVA